MTSVSLERISDTLFPEQPKRDSTTYGRVDSINADNSYQVQLNASGTTTRCTRLCDASVGDRVLVLIQANGHCAAIGRVGGSMGAIADYIIETGETDGWHWEKWYSGKAEAWATKTHSVTINENYGNGWYSSEQHDDIPSGIFTSMDAVTLSGYGDSAGFAIEYGGGQTTTRTCSYWLMRVEGSAQPSHAYISIMAKGRWK